MKTRNNPPPSAGKRTARTIGWALFYAFLFGMLLFDLACPFVTVAHAPDYQYTPGYAATSFLLAIHAATLWVYLVRHRCSASAGALGALPALRLLLPLGAALSLMPLLVALLTAPADCCFRGFLFDHPNLGVIGALVFGVAAAALRSAAPDNVPVDRC